MQTALLGGEVNRLLAAHKVKTKQPIQYKIGPDPASIDSAAIGGIVANNASGMCCGVAQNTYHTIKDLRAVFLDGTVLDTADPASCDAFLKVRHLFYGPCTALLFLLGALLQEGRSAAVPPYQFAVPFGEGKEKEKRKDECERVRERKLLSGSAVCAQVRVSVLPPSTALLGIISLSPSLPFRIPVLRHCC